MDSHNARYAFIRGGAKVGGGGDFVLRRNGMRVYMTFESHSGQWLLIAVNSNKTNDRA